MRLIDQSSLLRIDSTVSLPFFSACAAALSDQKLLSDIEADTVRMNLKDRYRQASEPQDSMFSELLREGGPLINLVRARMGISALGRLYVSWTLAESSEKALRCLDELSQGLLRKAELMFNQNFHVYRDGVCEYQTLFSTFLVEAAEQIYDSREELNQLISRIRVVYPSTPDSSDSGVQWEKSLALHLSYRYEQELALADLKTQQAYKALFLQWDFLGEKLGYITEKLKDNLQTSPAFEQILLSLEDWQGQLARIRSYNFAQTRSWESLEQHRIRLLASVLNLQEILQTVSAKTIDLLKTSHIDQKNKLVWPESERRELYSILLVHGASPQEADRALDLLESYCQQHQVLPEQLLATELLHIHGRLDEGFLQNLKKLAMDRSVGLPVIEAKQRVLQRKDKLLRTIQSQLTPLLTLVAFLFCGACGVKTLPQSEVLDLRPAVPYHAEQRQTLPPEKVDKPSRPVVGDSAEPTP